MEVEAGCSSLVPAVPPLSLLPSNPTSSHWRDRLFVRPRAYFPHLTGTQPPFYSLQKLQARARALNIHNARQSQPSYLPFIPVAGWLKEVTNDWEGTMKFRTNELTNKQMIVSIQRSLHSFRSRVIVHRTRPRVGLFKFALVVFGCNIDKMSHIAFMEVDENSATWMVSLASH